MELVVSRILHAGYIFECGDTQIIFDPIFENPFSKNCYAFPHVEFDIANIKKLKWNAVFISHYHDDHLSLESLNLIDRKTPIYLYCIHDELFSLIKALGFLTVHQLQINTVVTIGEFEVIPRKALDPDVDSIFHLKAAGFNILNVVDSWIDPAALEILAENKIWDLVLWPFQTLRELAVLSPTRAEIATTSIPEEWIDQLKTLNPRAIVPSSCQFTHEPWSWYNHALFPISYKKFAEQVSLAIHGAQVLRLEPSQSVIVTEKKITYSESLPWVQLVRDTPMDYHYNADLKIPTTAEIAKNFPALSNSQRFSAIGYCQKALIDKYNSFEIPDDSYFSKSGHWKLSLYDQNGKPEEIFYQFSNGKIEVAASTEEKLIWFTEVPIFKLHSALQSGESLTSMYVRINDLKFDERIETELHLVDVLQDPLIRCLFTGAVGGYQAAQLKQLTQLS